MRHARCSPKIYKCFTEGFDTTDLKEAKPLRRVRSLARGAVGLLANYV
jgi:hypothetical protein